MNRDEIFDMTEFLKIEKEIIELEEKKRYLVKERTRLKVYISS